MLSFGVLLVVLHGLESISPHISALIESVAGGEYLDEAESFLPDSLSHRVRRLPHVKDGPPGYIHSARRLLQLRQIQRRFETPVRCRRGPRCSRGGGSALPACHGTDRVVDTNHPEIHIPPRAVNEAIPPMAKRSPLPEETTTSVLYLTFVE